jgi:hypothetical protein
MPQKRLRLDIDMDAGVASRVKHAGTNAWNRNEWSLKGSDDSIDWHGEDNPDVSVGACLDASHSRAADVAVSVSPFMVLTGRSHLVDVVSMGAYAKVPRLT